MQGRKRRTFDSSGTAGGVDVPATASATRSNAEIMESIGDARSERSTWFFPDAEANASLTPEEAGSVLDAPDASWRDRELVALEARANLDTQLQEAAIPEAQRATLVARMEGLSGTDLVREMRAIEHALQGPNADRAMAALAELDGLRDAEGGERITSEMVEMLIDGVADSRVDPREAGGEGGRGVEGVLGVGSVVDAARGLMEMSDEDYTTTVGMLRAAGTRDGAEAEGSDAGFEQALVMRAIAARQGELADGAGGLLPGGRTGMEEVRRFATSIRGMDRGELSRLTTARDLHDTNDSLRTPGDLASGTADQQTDNDGLYQRFTESCGPTAMQMVRAEADPAYAMSLHQDGRFDDPSYDAPISMSQGLSLQANGGRAVSRMARQTGETDAVGAGMMVENALDADVGPTTNSEYGYTDGLNGELFQNLEQGEDVIVRVGVNPRNREAGHYLVASDMRGEGTQRQYLFSDPMTGATRWVRETEVQAGRLNQAFNYTETPEGTLPPDTPFTHTFEQED